MALKNVATAGLVLRSIIANGEHVIMASLDLSVDQIIKSLTLIGLPNNPKLIS